MLRARLLAVAFLIHDDRLLLIKRSPDAKMYPGMYAPIGGHIQGDEIRDPRAACLREIREETGLTPERLVDFSLRYIIHQQRASEVSTQYVYFGTTNGEDVGRTEEGELHWAPLEGASELNLSTTSRFALRHYAQTGLQNRCVYVGTVDVRDGTPAITWARMQKWET